MFHKLAESCLLFMGVGRGSPALKYEDKMVYVSVNVMEAKKFSRSDHFMSSY